MEKFVLAENPMSNDETPKQYILHLPRPTAIIQIHLDKITPENKYHKHFEYLNNDGINEQYTFSVLFYFSEDFSEDEKKVYKLIDKAWRWYLSYLRWEDNNIDLDNYAKNN